MRTRREWRSWETKLSTLEVKRVKRRGTRSQKKKVVAMESEIRKLERQIDGSEMMIIGLMSLRLLSLLVPVELRLEQLPSACIYHSKRVLFNLESLSPLVYFTVL
ncbi:hypothetical protein F2Q69_00063730 [Brassica cretica]|uniref:Uncharacterized protein n=1 Tax=Brassica cretica TaxID=69181 RepID=A0A8S9REA8_BRACR|nr:hypothetical protein F2Q69_00063730 [Brassica cretica]